MASLVQHIRFAKVLPHRCIGSDVSVLRGVDLRAKPSACTESGWSGDAVEPLIVNTDG